MKFVKLKRAVIKEELVALTGDAISAVVLNQMLYWSERVKDFDKMIEEETKKALNEGIHLNMPPKNGWIYKKAAELNDELMLGKTERCIRNKLNYLVEKNYLFKRKNPIYKWDRTTQYRVNFPKIKEDLKLLGYELQGYKFDIKNDEFFINFDVKNVDKTHGYPSEKSSVYTEESSVYTEESSVYTEESSEQYQRLPSENTNSKITSKEVNDMKKVSNARVRESKKTDSKLSIPKENKKESFDQLIEEHIKKGAADDAAQRDVLKQKLKSFLQLRFMNKKGFTNQTLREFLEKLIDTCDYQVSFQIGSLSNALTGGYNDIVPPNYSKIFEEPQDRYKERAIILIALREIERLNKTYSKDYQLNIFEYLFFAEIINNITDNSSIISERSKIKIEEYLISIEDETIYFLESHK